MRFLEIGIGFFVAAYLAGCGVSSDTVRLDSVDRVATDATRVGRFTSPPEESHRVIARIQVGPDALVSDYAGQTDELIRIASELGADGVVLDYGSRSSSFVTGSASGISGYSAESKFTVGQAFVWLKQ